MAGTDDRAEGVTAVSARVSKDYVRTKLPDGSFEPEEYVLGKGGRMDGSVRDDSIDNARFIDIARAIEGPLASQRYFPVRKVDSEKLIIMVYWGTTIGPDRFAMGREAGSSHELVSGSQGVAKGSTGSGQQVNTGLMQQLYPDSVLRNQIDRKNAILLGFDSDASFSGGSPARAQNAGTVNNHNLDELVSELEDSRYFVVLLAYDFKAYHDDKKHKLLWETRFSIDERRNFFDKALPVMAQYASRYFGQDSHGLLRTRVPDGKVLMGEPKSLGEVDNPEK